MSVAMLLLLASAAVLAYGFWRRWQTLEAAGHSIWLVPCVMLDSWRKIWVYIAWLPATLGAGMLLLTAMVTPHEQELSAQMIPMLVVLAGSGLFILHRGLWHFPWNMVALAIHQRGIIFGAFGFVPWRDVVSVNRGVSGQCTLVFDFRDSLRPEREVLIPELLRPQVEVLLNEHRD